MKTAESPTMTLAQVCDELRKRGIPCSNKTVGDNIANGVYPFGRLSSVGPGGGRRFEIWRKEFNRWLAEQCRADDPPPGAYGPAAPPVAVPVPDARADQIIKWAFICTNPRHKEADCELCPYREKGLCMDALLADAASTLLTYTTGAVCA